MSAHDHPAPTLPPMPNDFFGRTGVTDPAPIAALLGATFAGCQTCYDNQVRAVAAKPLLIAHLATMAYTALKARCDQAGEPMPDVTALVDRYVSTLAAMFVALGLDDFTAVMEFAEGMPADKLRLVVEGSAALFADFVKSGAGQDWADRPPAG